MSDNVLRIGWSNADSDRRELRVLKMRGSAHETAPVGFEITAKGFRLT